MTTRPHSDGSGEELLEQAFDGLEQQTPDRLSRLIHWLRDPKSRKVRIPLGILFILASFLWFLPVLGIEFLPIGLLLIAQDVPFLRRPVAKMMLWGERKWDEQRRQLSRKGAWAGYLLGFSLAGLLEAILLRHILQWQHLLLGLQWQALQDMEIQVLADRIFLLLVGAIGLAGLWSLWRGRRSPDLRAFRTLLSHSLIGFGAWNVGEGFVFHWLLGLHRIRMDADHPLGWDLLWFAIFGLVPFTLGLLLSRRPSSREGEAADKASRAVAFGAGHHDETQPFVEAPCAHVLFVDSNG
ncbi:DUF2243 domain-containing protein [Steroidobacter sp. S1-65]|uniref:DUF2243 domain-containing protein n=1 Tax=Steroidobacter gossypii TaxID=2805490 RepID=A0ABS1X3P4_9GAMM|nr:DUF2243 domain-containing protein [Steroidobacter gossypii]MBM0107817.1 DUF2243 domain-containing protein [Steroidobacter gossypii]